MIANSEAIENVKALIELVIELAIKREDKAVTLLAKCGFDVD